MKTAGMAGVAATFGISPLVAENHTDNSKPKSIKKIITVEEHFVIPSVSAQVMAFTAKQHGGKIPNAEAQQKLMKIVLPTMDDITDVGTRRLQFMDEAGIDRQILSYGAQNPQNITDEELAISLCQEANNGLAELIKNTRSGFRVSHYYPLPIPKRQQPNWNVV